MQRPSWILVALLATTTLSGPCLAAAADDQATALTPADGAASDDALGEIVVTANRRAENLQKVPLTVAAITGESLRTRGITNTSALSGSLPNIKVNSSYGETQPNFTIRGVGVANQFNANTQSPVGVYFDDVYQGFRASHGAALYDLERVEVLKGPQGTLYGRNTTGGAINMITRKPQLGEANGYVTAGYGNYDAYTLAGAVEATLAPDKLGVRAAITRSYHRGYINNTTARQGAANNLIGNRDFQSADDVAGRVSVRAKPSDSVDIVVRGYFQVSNPVGFGGIGNYNGPSFSDPLGYSRAGLGRRDASLNDQGRFRTTASGVNAQIDWKLGDILVTSLTGYDKGRVSLFSDYDGGPNDIGNYYPEVAKQRAISQDLHASYETDSLQLIVGAYYGWQEIDTLNKLRIFGFLDGFAGPGQFNPGGSFSTTTPATALNVQQGYEQVQRSYAGFVEAKAKLSDTWSLTVGGRLTRDDIKFHKAFSLLLNSSGLPGAYAYATSDAALLPGIPSFGTVAPLKSHSTKPTGRVILSNQMTPTTLLYASYSHGYRSGTYNGASLTSVPDFLPVEQVDTVEAGFKTRMFDGSLQLNGAAFYNDYKGQQITEVVGGVSFLRSLDGKSYGAELEVVWQAADAVRINAAAGYLHSAYARQFLSPGDPFATDPRGIDLKGNPFPNAPKWTANLNPEITLLKNDAGKLVLNLEAEYSSHQYFDSFADRQSNGFFGRGQKSYALVHGRLFYDTDRYMIAVWGRNLTNKYYKSYMINLEAAFNESLDIPGAPRTFGVEATFRF